MGISWRFIVLKWSKCSPSPYGINLLYLFNENLSAAGLQAAGWREWSFPETKLTHTPWRLWKVCWHELLAISRGHLNKHEMMPCICISAEKKSEGTFQHLIPPKLQGIYAWNDKCFIHTYERHLCKDVKVWQRHKDTRWMFSRSD